MKTRNSVQFGRFFGALFASILIANTVPAANLTLFFNDATSTDPVEIITGQTSTPIPLGVVNDTVPDAPEDFLTGWQFSLIILPEAGATGTVTFATPPSGSAPEPPNYVLDGVNFGIATVNGGDELLAFDFIDPFSGSDGVQVPVDPGALLLLVELLASNDAEGEFGVYAVPGRGFTEWTDANPLIQRILPFENVPDGPEPVLIGSVSVRIPEPASFALMVCGLSAVFFSRCNETAR